jgi:hypothetical protein
MDNHFNIFILNHYYKVYLSTAGGVLALCLNNLTAHSWRVSGEGWRSSYSLKGRGRTPPCPKGAQPAGRPSRNDSLTSVSTDSL